MGVDNVFDAGLVCCFDRVLLQDHCNDSRMCNDRNAARGVCVSSHRGEQIMMFEMLVALVALAALFMDDTDAEDQDHSCSR